jgi:ParB-like chromosome segregation protein Spo0J
MSTDKPHIQPLKMRPIAVDRIEIWNPRLRRLRPEKVAELAESIAVNGLLEPIVVWEVIRGRPWD